MLRANNPCDCRLRWERDREFGAASIAIGGAYLASFLLHDTVHDVQAERHPKVLVETRVDRRSTASNSARSRSLRRPLTIWMSVCLRRAISDENRSAPAASLAPRYRTD